MSILTAAYGFRVQQLLKETESYLQKLGEKLAAVTKQARQAEVGEGLAAAEPVTANGGRPAAPVKFLYNFLGSPLLYTSRRA